MSIFNYTTLSQNQKAIQKQCHDKGYFLIEDIPGFRDTYDAFLAQAQKFIALPHAIKMKYSPDNSYELGWSYGIERFYGVLDSFKGSYFGEFAGDDMDKNIWPTQELPEFQSTYLALAELIYVWGNKLLPILNIPTPIYHSKTRMLYYGAIDPLTDDDNPLWCGIHRDHTLITGLCPALYVKEGRPAIAPQGSGLKIREEVIEFPQNCLAFQMGEVAELVTDGNMTATDHGVVKSYGYGRYTMAVFMNPDKNKPLYSNIDVYNDRFVNGMTFEEWSQASYRKYNPTHKDHIKKVP